MTTFEHKNRNYEQSRIHRAEQRPEAAEAALQAVMTRAEKAEQERDDCKRRMDEYADGLMEKTNAIIDLRRQLAEAQAKLKSALNEVDDDVTRLQWLQSMITMVTVNIEVVSGGDVDAGLTCISEVQALHDDLKRLVSAQSLQQFERTAPLDWREAQIGKALDSMTDDWDHDTGDLTNEELSDEAQP